jgi:hypothetical protein
MHDQIHGQVEEPSGTAPRPRCNTGGHTLRTNLATLIKASTDGRSIRSVERDAGLPEKAIAAYIRPGSNDSMPKEEVRQYIADAIGVPYDVVTFACMLDAGLPIAPTFAPEQLELLARIGALPAEDQRVVERVVAALEERRDATRQCDIPETADAASEAGRPSR